MKKEKHVTSTMGTVIGISQIGSDICILWFFIWLSYEKRYMEEANLKSADNVKTEVTEDNASSVTTSKTTVDGKDQKSKKTTSSTDQDLDVFLLGEDSDDGPGMV